MQGGGRGDAGWRQQACEASVYKRKFYEKQQKERARAANPFILWAAAPPRRYTKQPKESVTRIHNQSMQQFSMQLSIIKQKCYHLQFGSFKV